MTNISIIDDYRKALPQYWNRLRALQREEQRFYDDDFPVGIKSPYHTVRTGTAAKIVDTMVEHINADNAKVYREPRGTSEAAKKRAAKVARFLNLQIRAMREEIEEGIKNAARRGEGLYVAQINPKTNRLIITAPDPLNCFPDPQEYHGIPVRLVKEYEVAVGTVKSDYSGWEPKKERKSTENVKYFYYIDNESRYLEADKVSVLGPQPNFYGFIPAVHFASGFGKNSPDGKPEDKYVGRLRKVKGKLIEECEVESRLDSILGLWANPVMNIIQKLEQAGEPPDDKSISFAPGSVNVIPWGWDIQVTQGDQPSPELFRHLANIKYDLGLEVPPVASGISSGAGASGRKEDILTYHFQRKPTKLIHNVEEALSRILGIGLRIIEMVPESLPITFDYIDIENGETIARSETLTKEDIEGYYECEVELKGEDPTENAQKVLMGRQLVNENLRSLRKFFIEDMGMTQDEAEDEMIQILAERNTSQSQLMNELITRTAAERAGMSEVLRKMEAEVSGGQGQTGGAPPRNFTSAPGSRDVVRQMLEAGQQRRPPL